MIYRLLKNYTNLLKAIDSKVGLGKCISLRNAGAKLSRDGPKVINNSNHGPAYVLFCIFQHTVK